MRVIGLDPGTARLGYGIVEEDQAPQHITHGVIETRSTESMPSRLLALHAATARLLDEHRPDVVAVEQLFFARNVTTALTVGQARGVLLLAAAQANVAVVEYTPSEVKQAIVGYGKADKTQVQRMVTMLLGLKDIPSPDDAADALAVALCHLQHAPFLSRTSEQTATNGGRA